MKQLIVKLVVPITIISFAVFTKWWYALPVDAPGTMYSGFPFVYMGNAWHTSMALQIFVLEFIADLAIYFLFWLTVIALINRFIIRIKINKLFTIILWIATVLIICFTTILFAGADNVFYVKRHYEIKVIETRYKFIWQNVQRPDNYKPANAK